MTSLQIIQAIQVVQGDPDFTLEFIILDADSKVVGLAGVSQVLLQF